MFQILQTDVISMFRVSRKYSLITRESRATDICAISATLYRTAISIYILRPLFPKLFLFQTWYCVIESWQLSTTNYGVKFQKKKSARNFVTRIFYENDLVVRNTFEYFRIVFRPRFGEAASYGLARGKFAERSPVKPNGRPRFYGDATDWREGSPVWHEERWSPIGIRGWKSVGCDEGVERGEGREDAKGGDGRLESQPVTTRDQ